jgi:hypothetical protein
VVVPLVPSIPGDLSVVLPLVPSIPGTNSSVVVPFIPGDSSDSSAQYSGRFLVLVASSIPEILRTMALSFHYDPMMAPPLPFQSDSTVGWWHTLLKMIPQAMARTIPGDS